MGLPIVTYLMNLLHLLGHVLPGASQVLERLDVRSLRHGASDNLNGDGTAGKLRERWTCWTTRCGTQTTCTYLLPRFIMQCLVLGLRFLVVRRMLYLYASRQGGQGGLTCC